MHNLTQDISITERTLCLPVLVNHCQVLSSNRICHKCQQYYQLKFEKDGSVGCEKILIPEIQNCTLISEYEPYVCLECKTPYYPLGDQCVRNERPVRNCLRYDGPGRCSQCQHYHILDKSRLICYRKQEVKCLRAIESEESFCVNCRPGFMIQNGGCVRGPEYQRTESNCLLFGK